MNLKEIYKIYCENPKICTDSRKITPGCIFIALKGEIYDGNKFAKAAIHQGAKYAIIDDEKFLSQKTILVNDTKRTLQELAKYHRNQINIPLIGITGTNGKTTTKELLYTILSKKYKTYATKGNLNSQIGLPLSILEIASYHEIAVIEMGADRIGEIKNLCEIAKPTSGIITNIGKAHLEGFGSLEGVIKAKTELYDFLKKYNGVQFVNGDDNLLVKKSRRKNRIIYGKETKSNFLAKLTSSFPLVSIKIKDTAIESHLVGKFQYDNIVAASCIGSFYNVSLENIKKSIESYIPKNNRTELIETKNNHIILDAYNANPSSMDSMIDSFIKLDKQKKICILGEMRELGSYSEKEHLKLIKKMKTSGLESIFIGKEYLNLFNDDLDLVDETEINNIKKNIFLSTADLIENISEYNLKKRTILIKGSRGLYLENIVKYL
ncbi:MAG: UDP-N-acetylmuramoyl-tripeptide--D-alanyl-D-alanine ligase [Flavobacteriales bacterium]|nr:UDP-N-acetylmuramoyl-tripeptide--D-alanyl-D-alanine ligase [Flavobacteriales bacterium]